MAPDLCADSMRRAVPLFQARNPDKPIRAVSCNSWIFNNQLEYAILPPGSNLVLFQREVYLYPTPTWENGGFWFIFQQDRVTPGVTQCKTSLQRAVMDFLAAGNKWRSNGGMFMLIEDLPRFGSQPYRRAWLPAPLQSL